MAVARRGRPSTKVPAAAPPKASGHGISSSYARSFTERRDIGRTLGSRPRGCQRRERRLRETPCPLSRSHSRARVCVVARAAARIDPAEDNVAGTVVSTAETDASHPSTLSPRSGLTWMSPRPKATRDNKPIGSPRRSHHGPVRQGHPNRHSAAPVAPRPGHDEAAPSHGSIFRPVITLRASHSSQGRG